MDLADAITRGRELAAVYNYTVTINIYLFAGVHYSIKDRGSAYEVYTPTQYYDALNLNYIMNIQPLNCTYMPAGVTNTTSVCNTKRITLMNKKRELFVIQVAVKLNFTNVIIDALDSILPTGTTCLNDRR